MKQLGLPLGSAPDDPGAELVRQERDAARAFTHAPPAPVAVRFVRNPRARRYILRLDADGAARVTVPRRGSLREARAFVERQRKWLERQRAERLRHPGLSGESVPSRILLDGAPVDVRVATEDTTSLTIGEHRVRVPAGRSPAAVLRGWLLERARGLLPVRLRELAATHGVAVRAVSVRNQRTRWGSCSSSGRICLNWRLVQMPASVRDYILVHELAHVKVPNHSVRFWRTVEAMDPHWRTAELWIRKHGHALM